MKHTANRTAPSIAGPMIIIGALFFIFGFITWLNSLLIPYLRIACELSEVQSYFVTFAFYIAYLVMAPVSTRVLNRYGLKRGMGFALGIMAVGAALFIPAALLRTYTIFLVGLFTLGGGLAILQTASNPYITVLGSAETAARRISMMGICNKAAGALAPVFLGLFLNLEAADDVAKKVNLLSERAYTEALDGIARQVINPYIGIVLVLVLLAFAINRSHLPEVEQQNASADKPQSSGMQGIFAFPQVVLGFIALFLYVGVEVLAGDTIIAYGSYLGIPLKEAKFFTGFTMGAMVLGYLVGIFAIPKYLRQEDALKGSAVLGMLLTLGIVFTSGTVSLTFVALLGLANALIWPAIWPMALRGLGKWTNAASGFLVMGIAGGAILPLVYGQLAHLFGSAQAYWIAFPCYLFIVYYGFTGDRRRAERI